MLRLREHRKRRGYSQQDLADATGISQHTISEIETGRRPRPQGRTLKKLAQALGVEVNDLFEEPRPIPRAWFVPLAEGEPPEQVTLQIYHDLVAYQDRIQAEIEQRDNEIERLRNENERLREQLAQKTD